MATKSKSAKKVKSTTTAKPVAAKVRKQRTGTKMEKCVAIMKSNPSLVRKAVIAKFISDAKLTKAGANTYYALVQKKLK